MTLPDDTRRLLDLVAGARVFDLGLPMRNGMAQSLRRADRAIWRWRLTA